VHLFIAISCHSIIIVVGLESASFCCLELSWDSKFLLFLSYSCYLDNKVYLCIARSCYVIVSASFCYLGLSRENKLPHSKDNNFFVVV
jgi:hypothetical protein